MKPCAAAQGFEGAGRRRTSSPDLRHGFTQSPRRSPRPRSIDAEETTMAFTVTLKPSGHAFEVPEDKSILHAGLAAGYMLPYSCQTGVCRTCRGTILEGTVDYGMVHEQYLSEADKAEGYALLCQAKPLANCVIALKEIEGLAGLTVKKIPCRVMKLTKPAADVAIMHLRLPMNENMRFAAGQYVEFLVRTPAGEVRRAYSIANAPQVEGTIDLELHIRHSPGGVFTDQVFGKMKERDLLRFEGPLGTFYLREDSDRPIVMVASGTGFAPIKSICEYAFRKGIDKTRPITLYWGCRTRADLYMADVPERWAAERAAAGGQFRFVPVLSDPTPECGWTGRTGLVHRAVMADFPDLSGHQVYACGVPVMVESARRDFSAQCRLPEEEFFADSFITEAERASA
jgi:CDP-4-dehydro-6-deoxyglucose reductase